MNGQVYLEIRDPTSLISFLAEAKKKTGMLKDVSLDDVRDRLADTDFPICIPVNLDGILNLCGNPILKRMFGKKVEDTTKKYLKTVLGAG